jgi:putative tryptophan/tyrosine transport system substrate-binding protein
MGGSDSLPEPLGTLSNRDPLGLAAPLAAEAQVPAKVPRIGFLSIGSPTDLARQLEAFRQGLRELGYVEGQTIAIEYRLSEGRPERLPPSR